MSLNKIKIYYIDEIKYIVREITLHINKNKEEIEEELNYLYKDWFYEKEHAEIILDDYLQLNQIL